MRSALIAVSVIGLLAAGCGSTKPEEPAPVVSVPLELDPTEDYELPAWWTNGDQMLHLDAGGAYALFEGTNRYHKPAQRGRWWQQSYAALRLEPYAELALETVRGSIRRIDQALVLGLPGLEPMKGIEHPPSVVEDRLLGRWFAEFGTLRLDADLRYLYSASLDRARRPAEMAGHGGGWRVEDDTVVLRPDSPGIGPILVRILDADDAIVLEAPDGRLARQPPIVKGG